VQQKFQQYITLSPYSTALISLPVTRVKRMARGKVAAWHKRHGEVAVMEFGLYATEFKSCLYFLRFRF